MFCFVLKLLELELPLLFESISQGKQGKESQKVVALGCLFYPTILVPHKTVSWVAEIPKMSNISPTHVIAILE